MLKAGIKGDTRSYNMVLTAFSRSKDATSVAKWLTRMLDDGCTPDDVSFSVIIRSCADAGNTEAVELWRAKAAELGIDVGVLPYDKVIQSLANNAETLEDTFVAVEWLLKAVESGIPAALASYNAVIKSFLDLKRSGQAKRVLNRMADEGRPPDATTYL